MSVIEDTRPDLPNELEIFGQLVKTFKGENGPQSPAGLYVVDPDDPLGLANDAYQQIEGADLSYNNITDIDCALQTQSHLVEGFRRNFDEDVFVALGVKHGNACGAGVSTIDPGITLHHTVRGDHEAIFGGTVMSNFPITGELADVLRNYDLRGEEKRRILDVVLAPEFELPTAVELLKRKDGACRIIQNPALAHPTIDTGLRLRAARSSAMLQGNYEFVLDLSDPDIEFYGPQPTEQQLRDIVFGWGIGCTSKSNTCTLVRDGMLLANATGQQKRNRATWLAVEITKDCGHSAKGSVAYTDSFFPFFDAVENLIAAGVEVVFASRGGLGVQKIIDGCLEAGISLVLGPDTKVRGFYLH